MFYNLLGIAIGASLAWYIPEAAANARYDPLVEVLEGRVQILKAEATRSFGNIESAERWLDQPNAELNDRSPRAASADIVDFEKATALLASRSRDAGETTEAA